MTMTIELPIGSDTLSETARQRLQEQVNAFVIHAIQEILNTPPDTEAIAAIRAALAEDSSEEMSLEEFATKCGVRL